MNLRWKQITEIQIDHIHDKLPAASLHIFHPFTFPSSLIESRPYLGLSAALILPFTNSFIMSSLTDRDALSLASFIVNQESLNPYRTVFVFDLRSIIEKNYRQIFFEWSSNNAGEVNETIWSAHRIIKKNIFRKIDLNSFIEADPELFSKYYERIQKIEKKDKI